MSELPDQIVELLEEHQIEFEEETDGGINREEILEEIIEDVRQLDRDDTELTVKMLRILMGGDDESVES